MNIVVLLISLKLVLCRDYYRGIFNKDDFLVAQDNVYKAKRAHGYTIAEYGRFFKCPITYFRVVDRLGVGRSPIVKVVRGGLLQKYIVVRIKSAYNLPLSVNIYVGCENKEPRRPTIPWRTTPASDNGTGEINGNATTVKGETGTGPAGTGTGAEGGSTDAPAGETTVAEAEPNAEPDAEPEAER